MERMSSYEPMTRETAAVDPLLPIAAVVMDLPPTGAFLANIDSVFYSEIPRPCGSSDVRGARTISLSSTAAGPARDRELECCLTVHVRASLALADHDLILRSV